jgi:2'-hydroxyisoflavone reductase
MGASRREFLGGAFALGLCGCHRAGSPAAAVPEPVTPPEPAAASERNRTLLMLGGTGFLGPHVVREAVAAGYEVTLFNRGKTNPHLFPDLEKLRGDRNDDLSALEGRWFDVVIDTSGYFPRQVEATAGMLAEGAAQYLFVSTISVYAGFSRIGMDESGETAPMPEPYSEEMPTHYGALKAGCERAAEAAMPGKTTIVRPGLIVGPGDPTDRFTYWPARIARGGDVLAPGAPDDPIQFIDVRDLAAWMVRMTASSTMGIFNATGPTEPTSIGALLQACKTVSGSDADFHWASAEFLAEHEVAPWMQMPVWVPPSDPEFRGFARIDAQRARGAGLTFRPIDDTVEATLAWWNEQPPQRRESMHAGIELEREASLLAALQESTAAA